MAIHTTFTERRSCPYPALLRPAESTIRETTVGAGLACRAGRKAKMTPIIRILLVSLATIAGMVGFAAPAPALGPAGSGRGHYAKYDGWNRTNAHPADTELSSHEAGRIPDKSLRRARSALAG